MKKLIYNYAAGLLRIVTGIFAGTLIVASIAGCSSSHRTHDKATSVAYYARTVLQPLGGSKVSGQILFSEAFGKVKVEADVSGLDPNSKHGFHIHEYGDCTAADGSSAGGHYNPQGHPHGSPEINHRHAGDLGNLTADKNGRAKLEVLISRVSINGTLNPIIGRAVIVHKNPDDLISQPTGGAGDRIACGVIGATKK
jgi:Cu-Zn family superoxide dismutase